MFDEEHKVMEASDRTEGHEAREVNWEAWQNLLIQMSPGVLTAQWVNNPVAMQEVHEALRLDP